MTELKNWTWTDFSLHKSWLPAYQNGSSSTQFFPFSGLRRSAIYSLIGPAFHSIIPCPWIMASSCIRCKCNRFSRRSLAHLMRIIVQVLAALLTTIVTLLLLQRIVAAPYLSQPPTIFIPPRGPVPAVIRTRFLFLGEKVRGLLPILNKGLEPSPDGLSTMVSGSTLPM